MFPGIENRARLLIRDAEAALDILVKSASERMAPNAGKKILQGAHAYLYATLVTDIARETSAKVPRVKLNGAVVPFRDALVDHLFTTTFAPILQRRGGNEFLQAVRVKVDKILSCFPEVK